MFWMYKELMEREGVDLWFMIVVIKVYMMFLELEESVRSGRLRLDGKVCLNGWGELVVIKFVVELVWYLLGVVERFGIEEGVLRRSLFEEMGGMYFEVCEKRGVKRGEKS